jgi:uncharacterized protein YodC (DUF2158 family)
MGDTQDLYNYAVRKTGIAYPIEAVETLFDDNNNIETIDNTETSIPEIDIFDMKIGTIVRLNSGGPLMTVQHVNDDICICRWFDNKELKSSEFNLNEICSVSSREKIPEITIDEDDLDCDMPF